MMINRLELIDKIRSNIQAREQRVEDEYQEALETAARQRAEYVGQTAQAWSEFATKIRYRVRRDEPVTGDDVPEQLRPDTRSRYIGLYNRAKVEKKRPRVAALYSLIAVLESSPDELVSTSALERMGASMREVLAP